MVCPTLRGALQKFRSPFRRTVQKQVDQIFLEAENGIVVLLIVDAGGGRLSSTIAAPARLYAATVPHLRPLIPESRSGFQPW
jgi:hypothetical protein